MSICSKEHPGRVCPNIRHRFEKGEVVHVSRYGLTQIPKGMKDLMGIVTDVFGDFVMVKQKGKKRARTWFWEIWEPYGD